MTIQLTDAQKRAVAFEKSGVEMYLNNADKTTNPLARSLFYSLAIEEIEHIMFIEEEVAVAGEDTVDKESVQEKVRQVFASLGEEEIRQDSDKVKGLELAMKLEKKGKNLYIELRDAAETEKEKAFYTTMIQEEERHLDSIKNVHAYLTETADWFHSNESSTWNWMNI